jgi:hypothetical protein
MIDLAMILIAQGAYMTIGFPVGLVAAALAVLLPIGLFVTHGL